MMGERIALVAILLIAAFLLSTQNSISVSAESQTNNHPVPIVRPNAVVIEKEHLENSTTPDVTYTPTPIKVGPTGQPKEEKTLSQAVTLTPTPTKLATATVAPTKIPVEGVDYGSLNEEEKDSVDPTTTPSPTVTPAPTSAPAVAAATVDPGDNAVWERLAECESHQNWSIDTGNGYYGGLQFSQGAWNSVGGSGNPAQASKDEQIMRGKMLQSQRGWGPWGGCSKQLGLL